MAPARISPKRDSAVDAAMSQRVDDLSTFASGMVHDLRNPLNVIRTNLYLLRKWVPGDEPRAARALERIDDQVSAAMRLLEGAQAFYRSDHPTFQEVRLEDVVRKVAASTPLPDGYQLETAVAPDLPATSAEPQLLDSALRALIRNAVESMPQGGSIQVTADADGEWVRLTVADCGEGMTPEVAEQAFEPFSTTRKGHGGLGLAMVDRVARAHGGQAYLETEPGAGTRVTLELPRG